MAIPVFPSGRKPGVKRDTRSKIMDRCDSVRSVIEVVPSRHWDELADTNWHTNRRARFRYTLDQDGVGSCGAESAAGIKAARDALQGLPKIVYNPWFVYQTTSGGRDNGSVIGDNVEFVRDHGIAPEEVWPRSKGWRASPSSEAKRVANFFTLREFFYVENTDEFVSALLQGMDIHFGYTGHAIVACQYLKQRKIRYKNSWGDWGDDGFGTLSVSNIRFDYGAYAYKHVRMFTPEEWSPSLNQTKLARSVNRFMVRMAIAKHPWHSRYNDWRDDQYLASVNPQGA